MMILKVKLDISEKIGLNFKITNLFNSNDTAKTKLALLTF